MRNVLLVLALLACGAPAIAQEKDNNTEQSTSKLLEGNPLKAAFNRIAEQEQKASQLVAQLDGALLQSIAADSPPLSKAASFIEKENELLNIDRSITIDLEKLYRSTGRLEPVEKTEFLVRTALLHWTILLRRTAMQSFRTEVPDLVKDPDCAGDLIADQLLQRYFQTLFEQRERSLAEPMQALAAIARQTACLGAQQSALLASHLYVSYAKLNAFLRLNGLYDVIPHVVQAVSQPLLLIYDIEKYRGLESPLGRWYNAHRETLMQGVALKRNPAQWHGLWLYDRRSGRLLGYGHSDNPVDENEVDLARFFASIASPENLGKYECSFAEMIERGTERTGYFCAGSACNQRPSAAPAPSPGASLLNRLTSGLSSELQATICQQSSPSGSGGGASGGRGSGLCGKGPTIAGGSRMANTIRCLSEQIVRPGAEAFGCIAEAMGFCSNPANKFAKNLQQVQFAGLKVGPSCQLSDPATPGTPAPAGGTPASTPPATETPEQKKAREEAERARNQFDAKWEEAKKAAAEAERARQREQDARAAVDAAVPDSPEARDAQVRVDGAVVTRIIADDEYKFAVLHLNIAGHVLFDAQQNYSRTKQQHCLPEAPGCGTNNCSAMSEAARQTLACFQQATEDSARDPHRLQTGGCNPQICDPIESQSPSKSAMAACFTPMVNPDIATSRQCWATTCTRGQDTVLAASAVCGCQTRFIGEASAGRLGGMCDRLYCSEGNPRSGPFGCTCEGSTAGTGGGALPNTPGPFDIEAPQPFSLINPRPVGGPPRL